MELPFELVYTPKLLDLEEFPEIRDTKDSPILATAIMYLSLYNKVAVCDHFFRAFWCANL